MNNAMPGAPSVFLENRDSDHALLLLHGLTGTPETVRYTGEGVARAGYSVYMPALPGRAAGVEDRTAAGWRDWFDCACGAYAFLRERYPRVTVGGLSMGGLLAILLAAKYPVSGLVCISAALKTRARGLWAMRPVSLFMPKRAWPAGGETACGKPNGCGEVCGALPTRCLYDLWRLGRMARDSLYAVVAPTLVIQPLSGGQVDPVSAKRIYEGVSAREKELVWLEASRRVCAPDPERDRVIAAILEHLRRTPDTKPLAI